MTDKERIDELEKKVVSLEKELGIRVPQRLRTLDVGMLRDMSSSNCIKFS